MGQIVKASEISEEDVYRFLYESLEKYLKLVEQSNDKFKAHAQILEQIANTAEKKSKKGIDQLTAAYKLASTEVKNANEADKTALQNAKTLASAKEKLSQAQRGENKELLQLRAETNRINAAQRKNIKNTLESSNAYKDLVNRTNTANATFKRLAAQYGVNDVRTIKARRNFEQLDDKLRRINVSARDGRRDVGRYGIALENAGRSARSMLAGLGLGIGGFQLVRGVAQTISTFEQSIADLQAITGAAGKDLQFYKDQAIELGKTTKGGAAAVVEAYKLIGSAKPELLSNAKALDDLTQKAIILSKASGLELPEAASRLTSALNQLGAPASEAGTYIDVLANASKQGSAEIPYVTDALLKFGAVARTSNVSIEESAALIETIAPNFSDASAAGTGLRNVMLKLAAPDALPKEAQERLSALGISFEDISDKSKPFAERLKALQPILKDEGALIKVFGSENVIAAKSLLGGIDTLEDFTEKMKENGTALDQANTRSKTLGEAYENIKRSWDSYVLSLVNGEDSTKGIIDFFDWTAKNIPTIISWVFKLAKAFIYLKVTMAALKLVDRYKEWKELGGSINNLNPKLKDAATGATSFGKAIKGIGLSAIIGLVIELAMAWYKVASGAAQAEEFTRRYGAAQDKQGKKAQGRVDQLNKSIKAQVDAVRLLASEGKITDAEAEKRIKSIYELKEKSLNQDIDAVVIRKNLALEEKRTVLKQRDDLLAKFKTDLASGRMNIEAQALLGNALYVSAKAQLDLLDAAVVSAGEKVAGTTAKLDVYRGELNAVSDALVDQEIIINDNSNSLDKNTDKVKKKTLALKEQNEYLSEQTELLNELVQVRFGQWVNRSNAEIEEMTSNLLKMAVETGQLDVDELERLVDIKYQIIKKGIDERTTAEISALQEQYRVQEEELRKSLIDQRDELLSQEELSTSQKQAINQSYDDKLKELELDQLQRNADLELKIRLIKEHSNDELIELEKQKNDDINTLNDELIEGQIEYSERVNEIAQKQAEEELKRAEELAKKKEELAKRTFDYLSELGSEALKRAQDESRKQQELIQEEIDASKALEDQLKESAQNQNAVESDSLKAQEEITNQKIEEKKKEAKKEEALQQAQLLYESIIQYVEDGDKLPIATAKASGGMVAVNALAKTFYSLAGFIKGTKWKLGDEHQAMFGGKDGHVVRVDGNEAIINPQLISKAESAGISSTDQLVNDAVMFNQLSGSSRFKNASDQVKDSVFDYMLLQAIKEQTNAIRAKKEIEISAEVRNAMATSLVIKEREGSITNIYKSLKGHS